MNQITQNVSDTNDTPSYFSPLAALVASLQKEPLSAQITTFAAEVVKSGGTWMPADKRNEVSEVMLHGVYAQGSSSAELCRNWFKAASYALRAQCA